MHEWFAQGGGHAVNHGKFAVGHVVRHRDIAERSARDGEQHPHDVRQIDAADADGLAGD